LKNLPISDFNIIDIQKRLPEEVKPYTDKLKSHIEDLQNQIAEMEICVVNSPERRVTEKRLLELHTQLSLLVKQQVQLTQVHEQTVAVIKTEQDQ